MFSNPIIICTFADMKRIIRIICLLVGLNLLVSSCSTTRVVPYTQSILGTWEVKTVNHIYQGNVEEFLPGEYDWVVNNNTILMNTNYEFTGLLLTIECRYFISGNTLHLESDPILGYEKYQITKLNSSSLVLNGPTSTLYLTRRR